MIETASSFLEYRRTQETQLQEKNSDTLFDSVLTIEINTTELCNRTCSFCPRVDPAVYPNRNLHIKQETIDVIVSELKRLRYKKKVSFSGFGEPLLYKDFITTIKKFREQLPDVTLETNTNGDRLTPESINQLFQAGLNGLYINAYDGPEQIPVFKSLVEQSGIDMELVKIRPHWVGFDTEHENGIILNNRSGALQKTIAILPLKSACYYPFYKMFIDYNGDVLCCSNDWMRTNVIGNVHEKPLEMLWNDEEWNTMRELLLNANRSLAPCSSCDVQGTLFGKTSVDKFMSTSFKMFAWVPDGTYDYSEYHTRYVVRNGNPVTVITKMWLDSGGPSDIDQALIQPWGTYPDFPPKPPKK